MIYVYYHAFIVNGITHRDIKPANLFLQEDFLKYGDFGTAKSFDINKTVKTMITKAKS